MKKDKEIAEINQSNVKSKNDKKRLNKTVWQKLTLDKSYLQLCMDRYALYLNETMNTEVLNLKMYSTSEIAYQLAQQFEDINYRTN